MQYKAGFILEAVREKLDDFPEDWNLKINGLFESLCSFDCFTSLNMDHTKVEDINSLLAVAHNIVTRGQPTIASPYLEKCFSEIYGKTVRKDKKKHSINYDFKDDCALTNIDLFNALHPINPQYNDRAIHLNLDYLESNFELNFLTKLISEKDKYLAFIFDQQRARNTLGAGYNNHGRVDFSLEIPYFKLNKRTNRYKEEVNIQNRSRYIVEVDGAKYHEQLIDDLKDFEIAQLASNATHITENDTYNEVADLVGNLNQNPFLKVIADNFKKSPEDLKNSYGLVLGPIGAARIQKTLLQYLLSNPISESLSIGIIERDIPCGAVAVEDLIELLEQLYALKSKTPNSPKISYHIFRDDRNYCPNKSLQFQSIDKLESNDYDLVIDISLLSRTGVVKYNNVYQNENLILIRNAHFTQPNTSNQLVSARSIKYRECVKSVGNEMFDDIPEVKNRLVFFLRYLFRMKEFRVGQLPILNRALQLKSVIGLLPTGGGKSLTYQLSALLQPGITLIVDPIKSLMADQEMSLKDRGISRVSVINSQLSPAERRYAQKSLESGQEQFVFLSPERYVIDAFRSILTQANEAGNYFSYVVIDEVHCVSEWGHNFRTPYLDLGKNAIEYTKTKSGQNIPLFGLTATASYDVLADIERELQIPNDDGNALVRYENTVRDEINYCIIEAPVNLEGKSLEAQNVRKLIGETKQKMAIEWLSTLHKKLKEWSTKKRFDQITDQSYETFLPDVEKQVAYPTLDKYQKDKSDRLRIEDRLLSMKTGEAATVIFCPHKNGSHGVNTMKSVVGELLPEFPVGSFMGSGDNNKKGKEIEEQSFQNQTDFKENKLSIMVATKAFGMGIDKENVRSTIHLNAPESIESFVQEAGRAGRDGKLSLSMILINKDKPEVKTKDHKINGGTEEYWSDYDILSYFHKLSFKGKIKERQTLHELRSRISFPNIRVLQQVENFVNKSLGGLFVSLNLGRNNHAGSIFLNDINADSTIGKVNLSNLSKTVYFTYNGRVNTSEAFSVLIKVIQDSGNLGSDAVQWLNSHTVQSNSNSGVEKMLSEMKTIGDVEQLQIPFTNQYVSHKDGYDLILNKDHLNFVLNTQIIRGAIKKGLISEAIMHKVLAVSLNDNDDSEQFIQNLKTTDKEIEVYFNECEGADDGEQKLQTLARAYYKPRTAEDTAKGLYRLISVGIIDTYTIDYQNKLYNIRFTKKQDRAYFETLEELIARYTTETQAKRIIEIEKNKFEDKQKSNEPVTEISYCLEFLTNFVYDKIVYKRKRAIDDMLDLCSRACEIHDPIKQNEQIKEEIYYYFNAKYSKKDNIALVDIDGKLTDVPASLLDDPLKDDFRNLIEKYLNFLNTDQTAQFKDNTKHLRGASMRILRDRPTPAIKILKGTTLLILSESSTNLIEEGSREILNGFIEWKKNKPAEKVKEILRITLNFIDSNVGNKLVKNELIRIQENFDLLYYASWTNDFKDGFLTNYTKT